MRIFIFWSRKESIFNQSRKFCSVAICASRNMQPCISCVIRQVCGKNNIYIFSALDLVTQRYCDTLPNSV